MRYVIVSVVKGKAGNFNNNLRKEVFQKFNAKSSKLPAHFTIKAPFEYDDISLRDEYPYFEAIRGNEEGYIDRYGKFVPK